MAATGLLALLDDLAAILDDVAVLSKLALKKTAVLAGDDLAVGAHQVVGLEPSRELPIIWAVAKGSLRNKCWLVPGALLVSAVAPGVILPVMMAGGAFLCYEGFEKLLHWLTPADAEAHKHALTLAASESAESLLALEQRKIRDAVKTDLILSAEIVVIALGAVAQAPLPVRVVTLSIVAVAVTVAIYGLIGLIVKMDDAGLYLSSRPGSGRVSKLQRGLGRRLLAGMPYFMRTLSSVGTLAMFLVGGGLMVHGIPGLEAGLHDWAQRVAGGGAVQWVLEQTVIALAGVLIGAATLPLAAAGGAARGWFASRGRRA
jgi:hypothetical protein